MFNLNVFDLVTREIDRLENDYFGPYLGYNHNSFDVDISEDEDFYTLSFLLPGMSVEDIDIVYEGGILTVRGERKFAEDIGGGKDYLRVCEELKGGKFERSFRFRRGIDPEGVDASYKDGVLLLKLRKQRSAETFRIKAS